MNNNEFKTARETIGLTISAVANAVNINRGYLSLFEKDKYKLNDFDKDNLIRFYLERGINLNNNLNDSDNINNNIEEELNNIKINFGDELAESINLIIELISISNEENNIKLNENNNENNNVYISDELKDETNKIINHFIIDSKDGHYVEHSFLSLENEDTARAGQVVLRLAALKLKELELNNPEVFRHADKKDSDLKRVKEYFLEFWSDDIFEYAKVV